ncbi:MAG: PQQ-dependent sugar dehydrogenase [Bacteroidota bacterium]|nr:PQQ-dependent sugar dehydrogenase [Bacteroidota bacterium]MDP4234408.1 PQQ-dependent sugar dehydrogenase [Bacteroidota bacterium]MDP4243340.1 PQQ-dependent sugar dehydrogenase [Bacteroidota bacterium]MDP4288026.1 PQQ-dependent sugar dehydrogenase [Bacteroidota bacterium]
MNKSWVAFVLVVVSLFPPARSAAQASDPCRLAAWVMQQQPHTTRTLEAPPPVLRDTIINVDGVSHKISIPFGFTMTVFAQISGCRGLACSPDGVIYATSSNGSIYALPDHLHQGKPDSTILVASGLVDPHGIGFDNSELFVSNNGALVRLISAPASRVAIRNDTISLLPSDPALKGHHTRNFAIDTLQERFYVQVGSKGNIDTTDLAHRAQIVEMNLDGSGYRTFARGLRNAVGMDIDPRTGALWVDNNGMDNIFGSGTEMTANNPSESIYLVCDGANYGWPWCYGFRMRNPLMMNLDTSIVETFDGPVAEVLAHEAPLGLHFYRGTTFPALYHNAIFQCYHGSWDRNPPAPPRITVMWADSDGRNARVTDFVNGFQPDSTGTRWGRVVSIIEGGDSALYASDDQAGVIYRIAWTGTGADVAKSPLASFTVGDPVPNPASDAVSIPISLATANLVRVEVFDLIGRLIYASQPEFLDAGAHSLPLGLTRVPNANYVARLTIGTSIVSRQIVLSR